MSDAELERLPAVLREIVLTDRQLAAPVIDFTAGADLVRRREGLRQDAQAQYGHRLDGDRAGGA